MIDSRYIGAVEMETKRITEFTKAHSYDDYITVYSTLPRPVQHDVCTLLRHRSGGTWCAVPNRGSSIHIVFKEK